MRNTVAALAVTAGLAGGALLGAPVLSAAAPRQAEPAPAPAPAPAPGRGPGPAAGPQAERHGWAKKALDELVAKGTITQAQADAVLEALKEARPHHPRPNRPGAHLALRKNAIEASANVIGVSVRELRVELRSGKSIAQVAEAKGVPAQKVIDALVADGTQALAKAVESGRITQAQADTLLAALPGRAKAFVERQHPGDHLAP